MVNGWKVTAIISMILAIIFLFLFISTSYAYALLDSEWTYEYEDLGEDWCEISNEWTEIYNTQLEWLIYYDYEIWKDYEEVETVDCK